MIIYEDQVYEDQVLQGEHQADREKGKQENRQNREKGKQSCEYFYVFFNSMIKIIEKNTCTLVDFLILRITSLLLMTVLALELLRKRLVMRGFLCNKL